MPYHERISLAVTLVFDVAEDVFDECIAVALAREILDDHRVLFVKLPQTFRDCVAYNYHSTISRPKEKSSYEFSS